MRPKGQDRAERAWASALGAATAAARDLLEREGLQVASRLATLDDLGPEDLAAALGLGLEAGVGHFADQEGGALVREVLGLLLLAAAAVRRRHLALLPAESLVEERAKRQRLQRAQELVEVYRAASFPVPSPPAAARWPTRLAKARADGLAPPALAQLDEAKLARFRGRLVDEVVSLQLPVLTLDMLILDDVMNTRYSDLV